MDYENAGQWIILNTDRRGMSWLNDIKQYQIEHIFNAGKSMTHDALLGEGMRHAEFLYYQDDTECDICDNKSEVAIIMTINRNGLCVCLSCLKKIVEHSFA